jgi:hypothetical protein
MQSDEQAYHQRRAATQKLLAERTTDPSAAKAHRELAELHAQRARQHRDGDGSRILSLFS